jgi:hypothetical protein
MRYFLFSLIFNLYTFLSYSQLSTTEILRKSHNYYSNLNYCAFLITSKFKSAISPDTTLSNYIGIYSRQDNGRMLKQQFESGIYNLYDEKRTYFVNQAKGVVHYDNSKQNRSEIKLWYSPYWQSKFIFKTLPAQITNIKSSTKISNRDFKTVEITVTLNDEIDILLVDSLFKISQFKQIITGRYGTQYREFNFTEIDSTINVSLNVELKEILNNYENNPKSTLAKESELNNLANTKIDTNTLYEILAIKTNPPRYIYLDFFYKTCLPCIKSIPEMVSLRNSKTETDLLIYGIDPFLEDTVNWKNFRQLYHMNYPVIDGEKAIALRKLIFKNLNFSYPTYLLISSEGKIVFIKQGFQKGLLNTIEKHISKIE